MNKNTIIQGDALEVLKTLNEESVDLIFVDPPYWMQTGKPLYRVEGTKFDCCDDDWDQFDSLNDYKNFTRKWLELSLKVLKKDGSLWVIGGMQCIYLIGGLMQDMGFWIVNDVIWQKSNPTPNFMGTRLNNSHETLLWATKNKKSKFTFNYKTAKEINRQSFCNNSLL